MPAGDLLPTSGDTYAAELRGYLMSDTSDWVIRAVKGLGGLKIKSQDTPLDLGDGSVGASDFLDDWPLILNLQCKTGAPGSAELALVDLQEAWTASTTDLELHMWVPGLEHIKMLGRPRDLDPERVFMPGGIIAAQATFVAHDPAVTPVPPPEEP